MSYIVATGSEVEQQLLAYYEHRNIHYKLTYGKLEVMYRYDLCYQGHGIYGYDWQIGDYVLVYEDSKYLIDTYKSIMIDDHSYLIQPLMIDLMNQYLKGDTYSKPLQTEGVYVRRFGITIYTSIELKTKVT